MRHGGIYNVSNLWEPDLCSQRLHNQVTLGCSDCFCRCWRLRKKLPDTIGQLCAIAGPVVDAVALQVNGRGVGAWIVRTHNFDRTAVTGTIFFNYDDAVVRLLTRSNARQTDHQHWECLSELVFLGDITAPSALSGQGTDIHNPTPKYGGKRRFSQWIIANDPNWPGRET